MCEVISNKENAQDKGVRSDNRHWQKQAKAYYSSQTSLADKEKERQSLFFLEVIAT